MKKDIHPKVRPVVFVDSSCGAQFLLHSCVVTDREVVFEEDGKAYPMVQIESSSVSHPVYTGKDRIVAKEGRVARFQTRFKTQGFSTD